MKQLMRAVTLCVTGMIAASATGEGYPPPSGPYYAPTAAYPAHPPPQYANDAPPFTAGGFDSLPPNAPRYRYPTYQPQGYYRQPYATAAPYYGGYIPLPAYQPQVPPPPPDYQPQGYDIAPYRGNALPDAAYAPDYGYPDRAVVDPGSVTRYNGALNTEPPGQPPSNYSAPFIPGYSGRFPQQTATRPSVTPAQALSAPSVPPAAEPAAVPATADAPASPPSVTAEAPTRTPEMQQPPQAQPSAVTQPVEELPEQPPVAPPEPAQPPAELPQPQLQAAEQPLPAEL